MLTVEVHKQNEHILNESLLKLDDDEHDSLEQEIAEAFRVFDRNNDGLLCRDDVRSLLANVGVDMNRRELSEFMSYGDRNRDGLIDFTGEFIKARRLHW